MKAPRAILLCAVLAVSVLLLTSCSLIAGARGPAASADADGLSFPKAPSGQFKAPEDAINWFAESLKKNDFPRASEAFAVGEIPEKLDWQAYTDRLQVVYVPLGYLPAEYKDLNSVIALQGAASCYRSALFGLCGVDTGLVIVKKSEDTATQFVSALSPEKLAGLKVQAQDFETTLPGDEQKQRNQKNMALQAKVYGADECKAYIVELSLESHRVSSNPMILGRYGSDWKIISALFTVE